MAIEMQQPAAVPQPVRDAGAGAGRGGAHGATCAVCRCCSSSSSPCSSSSPSSASGSRRVPHNEQNLRLRFLPPAWLDGGDIRFLLGTDNLGRDVLSRIIVGARASFIVAMAALAFGSVLGSLIGLVSGYFGGRFDAIVMRTADGTMAFPLVLAALLLVAVIGPGVHTVVIAASLFSGRASRGSSAARC